MINKLKTIQVASNNQLKVAKALKKIAEELFQREIEITFSAGDFVLKEDNTINGMIDVNEKITIIANTQANLLAVGTQALLRLFIGNLEVGQTKVDFQQEQRILMIDMGRKFFSKKILFKFIDSMSLAQFNYLQLHFSENEGFRIESEVAPEIVSQENLTKDDIREIILYADNLGIEIIPDFDTPGHLRQLLQHKPEWQLRKKMPDGQFERQATALDISNQSAVTYLISLYQEYAELFSGSTYFHIGGDEFVDFDEIDAFPDLKEAAVDLYGENATAMDYFIHYVNQLAEIVSAWGFIPRVWNDGFFRVNRNELVKLSEKVEITYWTKWHQNMAPVSTFSERDYQIINFNDNYFYYVLGENAGYAYPTYEKIMSDWHPVMYAQAQKINTITDQYPGVALAIWSDKPEAQDELTIWKNVTPLLFAISQKETDSFMSLTDIKKIMSL